MPNSVLEQLERDAKKQGAYQAKVAYANYLLEKSRANLAKGENPEKACEKIDELLETVIKANKNWYQSQAYFLKAQLFEYTNERKKIIKFYEKTIELKNNDQDPYALQACTALARLYKDNNKILEEHYEKESKKFELPNKKIILTKTPTPEYLYKQQRPNYKKLSGDDYISNLKSLLNNAELTDTLEAKVYYQLVHTTLRQAQKMGNASYLKTAAQYCEQLKNSGRFRDMEKTKKIVKLQEYILEKEKEINSAHEKIQQSYFEPPYTTEHDNPLIRFFNIIRNEINLFFTKEERTTNAEQKKSEATKEMLNSMCFEEYFKKKDPMYGNIQDDLSNGQSQTYLSFLSRANRIGDGAYGRVPIHSTVSFGIKTMDDKLFQFQNMPRRLTIQQVKEEIERREGVEPDQQRIIFSGRPLEDDDTLENIPESAEMFFVLRLKGD